MGSLRSTLSTGAPSQGHPVGTSRAVLGLAVPSDTMTEEWTPQNVPPQVGKLRLGVCGGWGDLRTAHSRPGPAPAQSPATGLSEETLAGGARTSGGSDPAGDQVGPVVAEVTTGRQAGRAGYEEEEQGDTVGCWPALGRGRLTTAVCTTAETGFWDPATGEANSSVWPFSAHGWGHHSIPVGSSAGGRGSLPGTFKEMDRERHPCVLVTHQNPLWFGPAMVGAWASTSWATCA